MTIEDVINKAEDWQNEDSEGRMFVLFCGQRNCNGSVDVSVRSIGDKKEIPSIFGYMIDTNDEVKELFKSAVNRSKKIGFLKPEKQVNRTNLRYKKDTRL